MESITRQSIMTESACYQTGRTITPKGIMVHSTATPGLTAEQLRSRWNSRDANAAVHAILDETEGIQTLPWKHRGWHAGTGTSGKSANNTHISFECCEPYECRLLPVEWLALKRGGKNNTAWAVRRLQEELTARGYDPKGIDGKFGPGCEEAVKAFQRDAGLAVDGSCGSATRAALAAREGSYLRYDPAKVSSYFEAVWERAVALCAQLCTAYGIDPDTGIICHSEGHEQGIASNHADVLHWWPEHGKNMDDFRAAVRSAMAGTQDVRTLVQERFGLTGAEVEHLAQFAGLLEKLAGGKA